jgi:hypothetical protein
MCLLPFWPEIEAVSKWSTMLAVLLFCYIWQMAMKVLEINVQNSAKYTEHKLTNQNNIQLQILKNGEQNRMVFVVYMHSHIFFQT